jgi:DNA mismatch repair protein MutS2
MPLVNQEVTEVKKILEEISAYCFCRYGVAFLFKLTPATNHEYLVREIVKVNTLSRHYIKTAVPEPGNIEFIDNLLDKSHIVNFLLEEELYKILSTLKNVCHFISSLSSAGIEKELSIDFRGVDKIMEYCQYVQKHISDQGYVKPDATPVLNEILNEKEICKSRLHKKLDRYLTVKKAVLQDTYFTVRGGRYVLPVKAGFKKDIKGVVRDTSQSGDTLFIEPYEVSELNDSLFLLLKSEEKEKEKILKDLTDELKKHTGLILSIMSDIGYFDSILARAKYMLALNLHFPQLSSKNGIYLIKASHPVYAKRSDIVSNDFILREDKKILLITGPNGGGKTVALKTISSIIILTQMGIPTPVSELSKVGLYKKIYFDMGDTQDMETGMSSFTAKMFLWKYILDNADKDSLVLVDELGNFTNPYEGAAISCAFIDNLLRKGATLLAGTHLDQIKEYVFAMDLAETASMLWDEVKMTPRYAISYGLASGSFAVDMAKKAGFSASFIEECENLLSSDYIYLDRVKRKNERALSEAERKLGIIHEKLKELDIVADEKKILLQKLKQEGLRMMELYRDEVDRLLKLYRENLDAIPKNRLSIKTSADALITDLREINRNFTEKLIPHQKKTYQAGDNIYLPVLKLEGKITGIEADKVHIIAGNMKLTVPVCEIQESSAQDNLGMKINANRGAYNVSDGFQPEDVVADLRGKKVDEALDVLDKIIDSAILIGLTQIKIIHGAGKGNLKEAVHNFLKSHRMIISFKTGGYMDRGGSYYTLAEIK